MPQQLDLELLSREDRVILAIQLLKSNATMSVRRAAATYNVPETTLRDRRAGQTSRRDTQPNRSKLSTTEEETLIQYIRILDTRGFAPTYNSVRDMANQLLAIRQGGVVGVNWVYRLVTRRPELKPQVTRLRDHQRVLCSDPAIISPWFNLVRNVKAKYGILDADTYNFDETGFQMGVGGSVKVVTASERRVKPLGIQPGDREWVTLIAGINAMGWAIPPFFILKAKHHDQAWYHQTHKEWRIAVSDNGWTTNEIGLSWLEHFVQHTGARTVGSHRLLIIDGHESHQSLRFQDLCTENKVITLCMPAHASHILQPLDVGCFSALKRAYKTEIQVLANSHINHIDKKAFLDTYSKVHDRVFSSDNIRSSFRAAGLVPDNPEVVLSRLEIKPRTPSPSLPTTTWQPKTPSNALEIDAQSTLIFNRIRRHHSSSPASIIEMVQQFKKGAEIMVHSQVLLAARIANLEAANNAASERKKRRRKRIQKGGTLSQAEAEEIIALQEVEVQFERERREEKQQAGVSNRGIPHCRGCGKAGHNKRTCKKDAIGAGD